MSDVHILFAEKDLAFAKQLQQALSTRGWNVSPLTPVGSSDHASRIVTPLIIEAQLESIRQGTYPLRRPTDPELVTARCILVLWSRRSWASDAIKGQADYARSRGVLVQAVLDAVDEPPRRFLDHPWANMAGWNGEPNATAFVALARTIGLQLGEAPADLPTVKEAGESEALEEESAPVVKPALRRAPVKPASRQTPKATTRSTRSVPSGAADKPTARAATSSRTQGRNVFICYRREDSPGETGRLHDALVDVFGADSVFMDVDNVPFGVDFLDHVNEQLNACAVMIVVIGRSWTTATDKRGRRRLDQRDDYVRGEIVEALKRKIPVIPVRVQNAPMPDADDVPRDLRDFTRRNAIELSHTRWRYDMQQLLEAIRRFVPHGK